MGRGYIYSLRSYIVPAAFGDNCVATRLLERDARHLFHFFNLDTAFQTEYKRTVCCLNLTS